MHTHTYMDFRKTLKCLLRGEGNICMKPGKPPRLLKVKLYVYFMLDGIFTFLYKKTLFKYLYL
jgi:hypothetical protein